MTTIEYLVLAILILATIGLGAFFYALYQVMNYIENIEMYNGGDIIGVGDDNTDTINSDTSTRGENTNE